MLAPRARTRCRARRAPVDGEQLEPVHDGEQVHVARAAEQIGREALDLLVRGEQERPQAEQRDRVQRQAVFRPQQRRARTPARCGSAAFFSRVTRSPRLVLPGGGVDRRGLQLRERAAGRDHDAPRQPRDSTVGAAVERVNEAPRVEQLLGRVEVLVLVEREGRADRTPVPREVLRSEAAEIPERAALQIPARAAREARVRLARGHERHGAVGVDHDRLHVLAGLVVPRRHAADGALDQAIERDEEVAHRLVVARGLRHLEEGLHEGAVVRPVTPVVDVPEEALARERALIAVPALRGGLEALARRWRRLAPRRSARPCGEVLVQEDGDARPCGAAMLRADPGREGRGPCGKVIGGRRDRRRGGRPPVTETKSREAGGPRTGWRLSPPPASHLHP